MKAKIPVGILLVIFALLITGFSQADTPPRYNQVHLSAQQSESIDNDTMHVTLSTYSEIPDPARLAETINTDMEWALKLARAVKDVDISTRNYRTYPVQHKNKLKIWRGQQDLVLESRDSGRLGKLVTKLQERLQVNAMHFTVSKSKRQQVENRLIDAAMDAFKARADIARKNLGASDYKMVNLSINISGHRPPIPLYARAASMEAKSSVAVEAGESEISVTVSGTVEMLLP
jgi:predicted secreted protein